VQAPTAQMRQERTFGSAQVSHVGWIHELRIAQSPLFEPDAALELSKVTVLHGKEFGKTAITDWIAACAGRRCPDRWRDMKGPTIGDLTYFAPERHKVEFDLEGGPVRLRRATCGVSPGFSGTPRDARFHPGRNGVRESE
jgi:hypothetical protein